MNRGFARDLWFPKGQARSAKLLYAKQLETRRMVRWTKSRDQFSSRHGCSARGFRVVLSLFHDNGNSANAEGAQERASAQNTGAKTTLKKRCRPADVTHRLPRSAAELNRRDFFFLSSPSPIAPSPAAAGVSRRAREDGARSN